MSHLDIFSDERFMKILHRWKKFGHHTLSIRCGPLRMVDLFEVDSNVQTFSVLGPLHIIHDFHLFTCQMHHKLVTNECSPVRIGSAGWDESQYYLFICFYKLMKNEGFFAPEWEAKRVWRNNNQNMRYLNTIRSYSPWMRVKYPRAANQPLLLQNLYSGTYMKILPVAPRFIWRPIVREQSYSSTTPATSISRETPQSQDEYDVRNEDLLPSASTLGVELGFVDN